MRLAGVQKVDHCLSVARILCVFSQFHPVARAFQLDGQYVVNRGAGALVIITIRSLSSTASSTSCVTITTVLWVFLYDGQQLVLQLGTGQRVQCAKGLVEQQHLWLHRQRPCNTDALLHTA